MKTDCIKKSIAISIIQLFLTSNSMNLASRVFAETRAIAEFDDNIQSFFIYVKKTLISLKIFQFWY